MLLFLSRPSTTLRKHGDKASSTGMTCRSHALLGAAREMNARLVEEATAW